MNDNIFLFIVCGVFKELMIYRLPPPPDERPPPPPEKPPPDERDELPPEKPPLPLREELPLLYEDDERLLLCEGDVRLVSELPEESLLEPLRLVAPTELLRPAPREDDVVASLLPDEPRLTVFALLRETLPDEDREVVYSLFRETEDERLPSPDTRELTLPLPFPK
jgi:hypothetical protein